MTPAHASPFDGARLARETAPSGGHGRLRLLPWTAADVPEIGAYWARNREHLTPTQPLRAPAWWSVEGQRLRFERIAADVAAGRTHPFLVREDGEVAGELVLSDAVGGAFRSAHLGYSVDGGRLRRGIAGWAVAAAVEIAFGELGLHRLQAATLLDNAASQAVLERCSFERIGVARDYLAIAGAWRDHVLWQRVDPAMAPPQP